MTKWTLANLVAFFGYNANFQNFFESDFELKTPGAITDLRHIVVQKLTVILDLDILSQQQGNLTADDLYRGAIVLAEFFLMIKPNQPNMFSEEKEQYLT